MVNPYQSHTCSDLNNIKGQQESRKGFRRDFWPVVAVLSGGMVGSAIGMQLVDSNRMYLFVLAFVGLVAGGLVFRFLKRSCQVDFAARRRVVVIIAVSLSGPLLLCASGPQTQLRTMAYLALSMSVGFSIGLLSAGRRRGYEMREIDKTDAAQ
jgi:F0F1-type ATP synthase assembly protein I